MKKPPERRAQQLSLFNADGSGVYFRKPDPPRFPPETSARPVTALVAEIKLYQLGMKQGLRGLALERFVTDQLLQANQKRVPEQPAPRAAGLKALDNQRPSV